jgi:hypothetical protein
MAKRKTPKRSGPRDARAAVRATFKAWGLDQDNPEHWDELFEVLKEARQRRRGAPKIWTDTLILQFGEIIFSSKLVFRMTESEVQEFNGEMDLANLGSIFEVTKLILKINPDITRRLEVGLPKRAFAAFPELNLRRHKSSTVAEAHLIAWILRQRMPEFRTIDHPTLVKYILHGPPGTTKSKD